jgi:NAD(P)-dependent dehydrogenase (short-subunit alcohol dehydrogenase family)
MARAFAEQGLQPVLLDVDGAGLAAARSTLAEAGHTVLTLCADICDRQALHAAIEQVLTRHGALHVVCANAGVPGYLGPLQETSDGDWDWVIDINLKGAVNTVQACLPALLQHPAAAHIVLTSSISGLRVYQPSRGQGMYNTTKFALVGYGEALQADLGPLGVGVSILCPGVINTALSHAGRQRPQRYGGPLETSDDFVLAKAALQGTDPLEYGRWVLKAMEQNRLYVITHPQDRNLVERRHAEILAAFDHSADLTGAKS